MFINWHFKVYIDYCLSRMFTKLTCFTQSASCFLLPFTLNSLAFASRWCLDVANLRSRKIPCFFFSIFKWRYKVLRMQLDFLIHIRRRLFFEFRQRHCSELHLTFRKGYLPSVSLIWNALSNHLKRSATFGLSFLLLRLLIPLLTITEIYYLC